MEKNETTRHYLIHEDGRYAVADNAHSRDLLHAKGYIETNADDYEMFVRRAAVKRGRRVGKWEPRELELMEEPDETEGV
jgi:hypothetical protein